MEKLNLEKYFEWVIAKSLSEVEVTPHKSNQHEFNATSAMKSLLGKVKKKYTARFVYLCDDSAPVTDNGFMTWYDARENNPFRSEFRLFYQRTAVSVLSGVGDCMFLCMLRDGTLLAVVTRKGSMMGKRLNWLFGIRPANFFESGDLASIDSDCEFIVNWLLRIIGVEIMKSNADIVKNLQDLYGNDVPSFEDLCILARKRSGVSGLDDADKAIMSWMICQEEIVNAAQSYMKNVNTSEAAFPDRAKLNYDNTAYILGGKWQDAALKSHLRALLDAKELQYEVYGDMEKQSLFLPDASQREKGGQSVGRRSVLNFSALLEAGDSLSADSVLTYVVTMDPGITEKHVLLMEHRKNQPVLPSPVQRLYNGANAFWYMSIEELLLVLSEKQEGRYGS